MNSDVEMERRLKAKGRGQVINMLICKAETRYQELIYKRRWRRSARWLGDYETKLLEECRGKIVSLKQTRTKQKKWI